MSNSPVLIALPKPIADKLSKALWRIPKSTHQFPEFSTGRQQDRGIWHLSAPVRGKWFTSKKRRQWQKCSDAMSTPAPCTKLHVRSFSWLLGSRNRWRCLLGLVVSQPGPSLDQAPPPASWAQTPIRPRGSRSRAPRPRFSGAPGPRAAPWRW